MTTKRVLGFAISLLNIIMVVTMLFPYSDQGSLLAVGAPTTYIIVGYAVLGVILGIAGIKVQMNFLSAGASSLYASSILIGLFTYASESGEGVVLPVGTILFAVVSVVLFIAVFIYSFMDKGSSGAKAKKKVTVVNGQTQGGPQQMTNSLNMNMPVNNYQALPVNMVEKQKAPMDVLLAGKDNPVPLGSTVVGGAGVQSHMAELGLQSINITQDNPTGAQPMASAPLSQPPLSTPPMQQPLQNTQPMPVMQPQPAAQPAPAPQPMQPRPDLLAGSQMSGQLDNSPFNQQTTPPGQGQFF